MRLREVKIEGRIVRIATITSKESGEYSIRREPEAWRIRTVADAVGGEVSEDPVFVEIGEPVGLCYERVR